MTPEGLVILLLIIVGLIALNVYLRVRLFLADRGARRASLRNIQANRGSGEDSP
jgi:hypothetical protein